ncbi:pentatricopeptide repeat-containing protein At3g05340 [Ipomoea triloba]|uniref:pentatricopeptide repeat-containing protein At3g05340 n=1 Tax=Ipomoea triloba TaxID=35885 RepID=UPI00125DE20F|nr:pentatricopeptide repeat-containing protein At3g05340 [Ipomoea triloba]
MNTTTRWLSRKLNPPLTYLIFSVRAFASGNPISSSSQAKPYCVDNAIGISLLLSSCGREGNLRLGSCIHAFTMKNPGPFDPQNQTATRVLNSLLTMYARCGELLDAVKVFEDMPVRDTVSWNSIISGFINNGAFEMGLGYFKELLSLGFGWFDHASLTTILSACDRAQFLMVNKMMHGLVFLSGYEREVSVGNALVTSYFRCGSPDSGRRVFDEMVQRNVITWTAIISGLAQNDFYEESLKLFDKFRCGSDVPNHLTYLSAILACSGMQALKKGCQIHAIVWKLGFQSNLCMESALMDMYSKCGSIEDAWQIFESAEVLDTVSLTVILVGFSQNGFEEEALQIFIKIIKSGIDIDPNVVSAILGVFGSDTLLGLGKQVHSLIIKKGFLPNPFVSNGLINMYSKCGELQESVKVFDQMPQRNPVSWNSLIAAFARHGNGFRALKLYEEMRSNGVEPTDVTFLSLLHACSHVGLVEKGMQFFESMQTVYGMVPRMEHYASVVDMLGRSGLLNEAKCFIEGLPTKPDVLVWQALLGACSIHGDTDMGKYAAEQWLLASPDSPIPYVLLANIHSSKRQWKERAIIIKKMKETGITKETGISWIEIEKKVHNFVVADQMHPQCDSIYGTLLELYRHIGDEGYVPDKRKLCYIDHDE